VSTPELDLVKYPYRIVFVSVDSSVGIAMDNGLDGQGSIPGRGKIFFSFPQRPDRLRPTQFPI
jgi:hypothetical protein